MGVMCYTGLSTMIIQTPDDRISFTKLLFIAPVHTNNLCQGALTNTSHVGLFYTALSHFCMSPAIICNCRLH